MFGTYIKFVKSLINEWFSDLFFRSSCSNDRCLFITNMDTMPKVDGPVQFSSDIISNTSEYNDLYDQMHPTIPTQDVYVHQSYHKAVDQNTETCWSSISSKFANPKDDVVFFFKTFFFFYRSCG